MEVRNISIPIFVLSLFLAFNVGCGEDDETNGTGKCADFPSVGESRTYRFAEYSFSFTLAHEQVDELVGGYEVFRIRQINIDPPGFGIYVACDAEKGEIEVATDWRGIGNPSSGRDFYSPPKFGCNYGDSVGTKCIWIGTRGSDNENSIEEVVGYEDITVPFGTFTNAMKYIQSSYRGNDTTDEMVFWINEQDLVLQVFDIEDSLTAQLKDYTPASSKRTFKSTNFGSMIFKQSMKKIE